MGNTLKKWEIAIIKVMIQSNSPKMIRTSARLYAFLIAIKNASVTSMRLPGKINGSARRF